MGYMAAVAGDCTATTAQTSTAMARASAVNYRVAMEVAPATAAEHEVAAEVIAELEQVVAARVWAAARTSCAAVSQVRAMAEVEVAKLVACHELLHRTASQHYFSIPPPSTA